MKDEMVGSVTILNITRLGPGSTSAWYADSAVGLGRIKNNQFICKFTGSAIVGSSNLCTLYGGIAGSPISEFAQKAADLIGSLYLGTTLGTRVRVKTFSTGGALFLRARVQNAVIGTPCLNVKVVVGRTIAAV